MSATDHRHVIDQDVIDAVVFDMDGVVTRTASVHAAAWKHLFDDYLEERAKRLGGGWTPFDADADYRVYVDGKPRHDGVRSFLASRDVEVPEGSPDDAPELETVCGLGNRKNGYFLQEVERHGVAAFESTVHLIRCLQELGIGTAVISASENAESVLDAAGVGDLFPVRVDGLVAADLGLPGKPDPAVLLEAARRLGVAASRAAIVEDALAGVEAGRRGRFSLVIGVDRTGHPHALGEAGADIVVADLAEVGTTPPCLPSALGCLADIRRLIGDALPAVFLDYDGTLTPIVARPEMAVLTHDMGTAITELAERVPVALISGRDLADLKRMVTIDGLVYAGSHGFDVDAPEALGGRYRRGEEFADRLALANGRLKDAVAPIEGAWVEDKAFAVTLHFRAVTAPDEPRVQAAFRSVATEFPDLRATGGKKVLELRPGIEWDKGRALLWLLDRLTGERPLMPLYIGDDETDEDAFRVLTTRGIGIRVGEAGVRSAAAYSLADTDEVRSFLSSLAGSVGRTPS